MRWIMVLALAGALGWAGCGDDDSGSAGSGGGGGSGGMASNEAPVITMVAWAPTGSCSTGSVSDYEVTVTATDDSTSPEELTYEGSVAGCTGSIDAATSTITCPNAAPYFGSVVVRDAESMASAPVNFTIQICGSDNVTP